MAFDEIRSVAAKLEAEIASGPIVPTVTPQEIRDYLASRYDFTKPLALDDVIADVERLSAPRLVSGPRVVKDR